ncbi:hypothetical protein GY45DRAFT_1327429 [Cubamyces sp. BRFM 1775]|nr:hypothetical protein GY45DRAFT_1327429 [Cubamyces sp. BRFM 1775]
MPSINGTSTETQEARPQLLASICVWYRKEVLTDNLQFRTSQFLKKVSRFRRKSEVREDAVCERSRSARSMDLGHKALSKVEVRAHHQSFDQERDSEGSSPDHSSLRSPPTGSLPVLHPATTREIDGLPPATDPLPSTVPLPINGRAQTLPSRSVTIAQDSAPQSNSVDAPTRRALAPRLATLPPPMMAGYNAEGRARLTPSLVTRQPPMPLLNLPTLPPPTPAQPARPGRPTAPLRSIPALPMQGPSDADQDADHENASLEDEDEEEEGEDHAEGASGEGQDQDGDSGESGDEDEQDDYFETSPRHPQTTEAMSPRLGPLPAVDTSRFSVSFADTESFRIQSTPHAQAGSSVDYFTSKSPEPVFSPMRTPRPADYQPPNGKGRAQDAPSHRVPQPTIVPMPPTPGSPRPGIYHHGSRSMVDLLSMSRKEKDKVISPKLGRALSPPKPTQTPIVEGQPTAVEEPRPAPEPESPDDVITSPLLRRRRSLPVYEPSSDPPPYPDPQFQRRQQRPPIQPREEEGKEELPPYSNAIYLTAVMPRKVEFTQPGVQARDRKWRRVYCVLEGTMFRVYKAPPAASTVSAIEQWWENKVGVGDITNSDSSAVTTSGIRVSAVRERPREEQASERPPKIVEEPADARSQSSSSANGSAPETSTSRGSSSSPTQPTTRSRLNLGARLLHRQRSRSTSRLGSSSNNNSSARLSMDSRSDAPSTAPSHGPMYGRRSMDALGASSRTSNVSSNSGYLSSSTAHTTPSHASTMSSNSSSEGTSLFSRSRFLSHTHSGDHHHHHGHKEKEKEETPYVPDEKDLIRKYTLQHAESGLASDYTKRKNVIRVRMEGEQFLLQAKNVAAVIDWIEGIQMGTNVALDLDERPMPRGPIFPRRRRRRVRRPDPATAAATSS